MVYTSPSETTSFYLDHRLPLSQQLSLPLPFLCVTTQEDIWLLSGSYQSSRLYARPHSGSSSWALCAAALWGCATLQLPRDYLRRCHLPGQPTGKQGLTPAWNLSIGLFLASSDQSPVTHYSLPCYTYTPIFWFLKDATFVLPQAFCTKHSLCPQGSLSTLPCSFTHQHSNIISSEESFLTHPKLDVIWFS